jgi:hypothetical protein
MDETLVNLLRALGEPHMNALTGAVDMQSQINEARLDDHARDISKAATNANWDNFQPRPSQNVEDNRLGRLAPISPWDTYLANIVMQVPQDNPMMRSLYSSSTPMLGMQGGMQPPLIQPPPDDARTADTGRPGSDRL